MDFNSFNNNDYAKKIFDDMFGSNEHQAEKKVDTDGIAKPLFEMFSSFVKAGFTEGQAMDLVKFMIMSAFKLK